MPQEYRTQAATWRAPVPTRPESLNCDLTLREFARVLPP